MYLLWSFLLLLALHLGNSADSEKCSAGTLQCDSGDECVNSAQWCDGTDDCEDVSDENYCTEKKWWNPDPNKCEKENSLFLCDNGKCVPQHAKCNGFKDCEDGSDEDDSTCDKLKSTTETSISSTVETKSSTSTSTTTEEPDNDDDYNEEYDDNDIDDDDSEEKSTDIVTEKKDVQSSEKKISFTEATSTTSTQKPISVHTESIWASTTSDYYEGRRKENGEVATSQRPATRSSTTRFIIPSTTPRPPQIIYSTNTTKSPIAQPSVHIRHPNRHHGRHDSQHVSRDTAPRAYDYRSFTYVAHPNNLDRRPPTYDSHPSSYGGRTSTNDRRYPSQNNNIQQYGNRHYRPYYDGHRGHAANQRTADYDQRYAGYDKQHSAYRETESSTFRPYNRETQVNKPFYFANDFGERFGNDNERNLKEAESWLLRKRSKSGDWGTNTARALIALTLASNSFPSGDSEYELVKRNFMVQLSMELLRNNTESFSVNRLATSMNALVAVCESPMDFHGMDLAELLRSRIREKANTRAYLNPFLYLSLCLAGKNLSHSEIQQIMRPMQRTGATLEINKDAQVMAIQAFSCYLQQQTRGEDPAYRSSLQEVLNKAVQQLLQRMLDDGSFGSVYSTALAAQALLSLNDTLGWNAEKTLNFLKQQQMEDGSFGDLLATYYVMPALGGRSLLHLRNIGCQRLAKVRELTPAEILDFAGLKQHVHYSIYLGYPLENAHSVRVQVPRGINFFDVMRVADYQDKDFRFAYEEKDKKISVYSVSGVPNDIEQGIAWHLYVKKESDDHPRELNYRELHTGDIRELLPSPDQHIIYWYHPVGLQLYN